MSDKVRISNVVIDGKYYITTTGKRQEFRELKEALGIRADRLKHAMYQGQSNLEGWENETGNFCYAYQDERDIARVLAKLKYHAKIEIVEPSELLVVEPSEKEEDGFFGLNETSVEETSFFGEEDSKKELIIFLNTELPKFLEGTPYESFLEDVLYRYQTELELLNLSGFYERLKSLPEYKLILDKKHVSEELIHPEVAEEFVYRIIKDYANGDLELAKKLKRLYAPNAYRFMLAVVDKATGKTSLPYVKGVLPKLVALAEVLNAKNLMEIPNIANLRALVINMGLQIPYTLEATRLITKNLGHKDIDDLKKYLIESIKLGGNLDFSVEGINISEELGASRLSRVTLYN